MKQAINIAEQEIEWHKANKSEAPTFAHAEAFIKGLEHLLDLFREADPIIHCPNCGEPVPVLHCENCGHNFEVEPPPCEHAELCSPSGARCDDCERG